jgi:glycosyltransferase involved in cell wall biosynthesis
VFDRKGWKVTVCTARHSWGGHGSPPDTRLLALTQGARIEETYLGLLYGLISRSEVVKLTGGHRSTRSLRASPYGSLRVQLARRLIEPQLEWVVGGLPGLIRILRRERPEVVVSSSHPYCSHLLCLLAYELGHAFRWIGDFGDPLIGGGGLVPTDRARRLWHSVEARILRRMDRVVVTTERTKALYLKQYPWLRHEQVSVIRNGYDPEEFDLPVTKAPSTVLAHVGSIYYPRVSIMPFFQALHGLRRSSRGDWARSRVRIVGRNDGQATAFLRHIEGVELLGPVSYEQSLLEMKAADLLLLWGNKSGIQIPGKVYQYIGSGRPILCMVSSFEDDLADLLRQYPKARVVLNTPEAIAGALDCLLTDKPADPQGSSTTADFLRQCTWAYQLRRLEEIAGELVGPVLHACSPTSGGSVANQSP